MQTQKARQQPENKSTGSSSWTKSVDLQQLGPEGQRVLSDILITQKITGKIKVQLENRNQSGRGMDEAYLRDPRKVLNDPANFFYEFKKENDFYSFRITSRALVRIKNFDSLAPIMPKYTPYMTVEVQLQSSQANTILTLINNKREENKSTVEAKNPGNSNGFHHHSNGAACSTSPTSHSPFKRYHR